MEIYRILIDISFSNSILVNLFSGENRQSSLTSGQRRVFKALGT